MSENRTIILKLEVTPNEGRAILDIMDQFAHGVGSAQVAAQVSEEPTEADNVATSNPAEVFEEPEPEASSTGSSKKTDTTGESTSESTSEPEPESESGDSTTASEVGISLFKAQGAPALQNILKEMGYGRISEIPDDDVDRFKAAARAAGATV